MFLVGFKSIFIPCKLYSTYFYAFIIIMFIDFMLGNIISCGTKEKKYLERVAIMLSYAYSRRETFLQAIFLFEPFHYNYPSGKD